MKRVLMVGLVSLLFVVTGCAPALESSIEPPKLSKDLFAPAEGENEEKIAGAVSIADILDVRTAKLAAGKSDGAEVTQPEGNVEEVFREGLVNALMEKGIVVSDAAPINIRVELRKWQSEVGVKAVGSIESEAAFQIEFSASDGHEIYSGNFQGSRASQFPLVSKPDIQDSLGLAMAQAIKQMLRDPGVKQTLMQSKL